MSKHDNETLMNRCGKFSRAFARDEEGGIIVLTLLLLFTMLVMGGMAVDFMRYESERSELQSVSDRAVLAAANENKDPDLSQGDVVREFFEVAGFGEHLDEDPFQPLTGGAVVPENMPAGTRLVNVTSAIDVNTFYLRLIGIDRLESPVLSQALASVGKVEISLVLDISGSMRNGGQGAGGRFGDMQRAAKLFASEVLKPENDGQVSLTIVPYAGSTNPGPEMFEYLQGVRYNNYRELQGEIGDTYGDGDETEADGDGTVETVDPEDQFENVSSCLEFTRDDWRYEGMPGPLTNTSDDPDTSFNEEFSITESASTSGRDQVPHFMNWAIAADVMDWGWCPLDRSAIRYAIRDYCVAEKFIDGIRMHDGTGTHYGMKYGLAALSPTTQPAFAALSTMTAADIVNADYTPSGLCGGAGPVTAPTEISADGGEDGGGTETDTSVDSVGNGGTVVPVEFSDRPSAWDDAETNKFLILMTDGQITDQYRPKDIFDPRHLTRHLRGGDKRTLTNRSRNVNDFYRICDLAKDPSRDVKVFTVAFETYGSGRDEMRNCASEGGFYTAEGDELSEIFNQIAGQITDLHLTQ